MQKWKARKPIVSLAGYFLFDGFVFYWQILGMKMLLERHSCKDKAPFIFHIVIFLLFVGLIRFLVFSFLFLKYLVNSMMSLFKVVTPAQKMQSKFEGSIDSSKFDALSEEIQAQTNLSQQSSDPSDAKTQNPRFQTLSYLKWLHERSVPQGLADLHNFSLRKA